jgi:hypothetical protein
MVGESNGDQILPRPTDSLPISEEPLTPEQFAQILIHKHIPIIYERGVRAAATILEAKPPELFLNRLASGFNFIGKESFDRNLRKMAREINRNATEPFHYLYFPRSRSSHWMYEQLLGLGMKNAQSEISTGEGDDVSLDAVRGKSNMFIIDDWLISGAHATDQIIDPVWRTTQRYQLPVPEFQIYVLYSSALAEKELKQNDRVWIADAHRIPMLEEVMSAADMSFLNDIGRVLPRGRGEINTESHTLTCGWWCIPDNIPTIFTNPQSDYMFMDPSFVQPY